MLRGKVRMNDKNNAHPHTIGGNHPKFGRPGVWTRLLVGVIFAMVLVAPAAAAGAVASGPNAPSQDFSRELGHQPGQAVPSRFSSNSSEGTNQPEQPLDPVAPTARTFMVSINTGGSQGGDNPSYDASISGDASLVAFDSFADDMAAGIVEPLDAQSHVFPQIYLRNISGPATTQLSLSVSDQTQGANGASEFPALSSDGKWAAWRSCATDLVTVGVSVPCAGTSDNGYDGSDYQIFLRDLANKITTLVTTDYAVPSNSGNYASGYFRPPAPDSLKQSQLYYPGYIYTPVALSANGALLVYQSTATNLVAGLPAYNSTNPVSRIFLYNAANQTNTLISNPADTCGAEYPRISGDGRYIVYSSCITINLPGFTQTGVYQIYLVDRDSHGDGTMVASTKLISGGYDNHPGNGQSLYPAISADGSTVAFRSSSDNLDIGFPIFKTPEIFMYNRLTSTVGLISRRGQIAGNAEATFTSINSTGQFVAFASHANNLVPNDTNIDCPPPDNPSNCPDVFIFDNFTSFVKRVSLADTTFPIVPPPGVNDAPQADQGSYYPSISADGVYVAFDSNATNLTTTSVPNGFSNVYLHYRGVPGTEPDDNLPQINVTPTSLVFINQDPSQKILTIKSIGSANLIISSITGQLPVFKVDSETCTGAPIAPTKSCTATISYHQHYQYGVVYGTIVINSNDPANLALGVPLKGGSGTNVFLALVRR